MHFEGSPAPTHAAGLHVAHAHDAGTSVRTAVTSVEASCGNDCSGSGSGGMGLVGLCLAVLAGAVLGLALLLRGRIPLLRSMLPAFQQPPLFGRDLDTPDRLRLRVIRC